MSLSIVDMKEGMQTFGAMIAILTWVFHTLSLFNKK